MKKGSKMKWSKKDEAKWAKKRADQMAGHVANCEELERTRARVTLRNGRSNRKATNGS
jgi:hypothetical protein